MADYGTLSAEDYREQMEQMGASEADIQAATADLESRR